MQTVDKKILEVMFLYICMYENLDIHTIYTIFLLHTHNIYNLLCSLQSN